MSLWKGVCYADQNKAEVEATRAEALFASWLQSSQQPTSIEIRQAVRGTLRRHGGAGCAALVAQEFGEHPVEAVWRMRWALDALAAVKTPRPVIERPPPAPRSHADMTPSLCGARPPRADSPVR